MCRRLSDSGARTHPPDEKDAETGKNEQMKKPEEKQVAQQDAERQAYVVKKAEQEKLASVIRAEGDAEAAMKISEAIRRNGTGLIEVRQIDAAKDVAALAARSRGNITYLPSNSSSSGSSSGSSGILLNVDGK